MTSLVFLLCMCCILVGIVINMYVGDRPMSTEVSVMIVGCVILMMSVIVEQCMCDVESMYIEFLVEHYGVRDKRTLRDMMIDLEHYDEFRKLVLGEVSDE